MLHDPVITSDRFETAREQSGDEWTDFEVFDEERDLAPLREVVLEVVEGQYTHPQGPVSTYEMKTDVPDLVSDKVNSGGLIPDGVPTDVRERFARDFTQAVQEHAGTLYKTVRDELDPKETHDLDTVQNTLEKHAEQLVPESF